MLPRLGLRANLGQFTLLVAVNALVGAMVGQERAILPLLATEAFGLGAATAALTFIVAFGFTKAGTNLIAGSLADRYGRKPVLIAGWLVGVPVPVLLIWAPGWEWVVVANLLLGINQGLAWSMTVIMKIDLVGPLRRGLAMGFNEAAGYLAVAGTALLTGYLAEEAGLRPVPFLVGLAAAGLGLGASVFGVRETAGHARWEKAAPRSHGHQWWTVLLVVSFRDRAMSAASQSGLVNNLNDGMAWGLLPLYYAAAGLSTGEIGVLAAAYPAAWGACQMLTGAISDRHGRKPLIVAGMLIQAVAIGVIALGSEFAIWLTASLLLGLGTAMVYPTLLASIADVAAPTWRGQAVGTYRFWRDAGFVVGALVVGFLADWLGLAPAIGAVAILTAVSGLIVAWRMYETRGLEGTPRAWAERSRTPCGEL